MKLTRLTDTEKKRYFNKAETWAIKVDYHTITGNRISSSVVEYMANQDGKTQYTHQEGKEYEINTDHIPMTK